MIFQDFINTISSIIEISIIDTNYSIKYKIYKIYIKNESNPGFIFFVKLKPYSDEIREITYSKHIRKSGISIYENSFTYSINDKTENDIVYKDILKRLKLDHWRDIRNNKLNELLK